MLQGGILLGRPPLHHGRVRSGVRRRPLTGRGMDHSSGVLPAGGVVALGLLIPTGEEAVQILGVEEALVDDCGGIGVGLHVLGEITVLLEDVVDHRPQEGDVAARANGHVGVGHGASAGESWVHVDDASAIGLGFRDPLERDRMTLCHVGTHDQDAV